ncbi:outer membrane protein assembly factor BamB family protein [Rickettsiales endosymbiont of Stachyamoeba lipophora]|uniref:outer membrane protein assembly factor BamB family protein n=1 Tax=Rickettsiales endosymbiont of Stachyamoeba lipophora TaxID=2486578 RepID=UPI0013DE4030|nr:PQQ-binding-like beta-propeller repeat protein [Rickettsiales endosymbiont of Stachyamoeba lipophora]
MNKNWLFIIALLLSSCESLDWVGNSEKKGSLIGDRESLFENNNHHELKDMQTSSEGSYLDSAHNVLTPQYTVSYYNIPRLKRLVDSNVEPHLDQTTLTYFDGKHYYKYNYNTQTYESDIASLSKEPIISFAKAKEKVVTTAGKHINFYHANDLKWTNDLSLPIRNAASISDDHVCLKNIKAGVECFTTANGRKIVSLENNFQEVTIDNKSSPLIVGNNVIIPTNNGYILNYNLDNKEINWTANLSYKFDNPLSGSFANISLTPIISNEKIIVANFSGGIFAVNIHNGEILWHLPIMKPKSIEINGKLGIVLDYDNNINLINLDKGSIIWQKKYRDKMKSINVIKEWIIVTTNDNRVKFLNRFNGNIVGEIKLKIASLFKPVEINNDLYIISENKIAKVSLK